MSPRSWSWWAFALSVSTAGCAYAVILGVTGISWVSWGSCPGSDFYLTRAVPVWSALSYIPFTWLAGLPAVATGLLVFRLAVRRGRPQWGRITTWILSTLLFLTHGGAPVAFSVDLLIDRSCLDTWGGPPGVRYFVLSAVAPLLAAVCMLLAVRQRRQSRGCGMGEIPTPRHE
ncbi:hypothetical protein IMZ11_05285 [Microtetraspora sp. AC03309]|uniref:hypothetical protein n=1 Tax=Microtetraspora sp. AC03309 TaxID=2779376 RepID=UPI001E312819|nr:hypothetical protein [Microtetraspora sp. AC03309]MCC5575052.1 hypothetical protein [Microtetraspora sp. AC03309]